MCTLGTMWAQGVEYNVDTMREEVVGAIERG